MVHNIQEELVEYENVPDTVVYEFKPYQQLDNTRILQFSRFTSSVSYLLKEMVTYQKREITACIIVSIRNKLNDYTTYGNFLKYACFTVIPSDSVLDICSKLQNTVKNVQSIPHCKENTTLYDLSSALKVDYIFDSWRGFSSITTKSNRLLLRQPTHMLSERDVFDLKHIKNRSFIVLDFLDNHYIVSTIAAY